MFKATSLFAASLLALGLGIGFASAQTGPVGQVPGNNFVPQGQAQGQPLTEQNLPQMLQAAGYQFQEIIGQNGAKTWRMNLQHNGWRFEINLELIKENGQYKGYGLSSSLARLDSNPSLAMAQLEKAMIYNFNFTNGYRFALSVDPSNGSRNICLVTDIYDTKMTVQLLQNDIVNFMNRVQATQQVWTPGQVAPTQQPVFNPSNPVNPVQPSVSQVPAIGQPINALPKVGG